MMSPDSRQTSLKSSHSNSFAFTNFNSAQQTACFVQKERKSVIFFFYIMCAKACDSWIHTSVLKESRYLVLGGSRDTVEGTQLGQSLHKVSVLSIQGAYSDSCHGKVLEITKKKLWKQRSNEILLYCQQGYKKSQPLSQRVQHSTYLAHPPHHMRPLWVGQTEMRAHHQQLRGCLQPQLLWLSVRQSNHVEVRFTQYLSTLRTLWKVTDSSNTVSMYTSSTMAWSSFLKGGKWRRRRDDVKIKSAALTNLCFISLMIVNDKTNAT